MATRDDSVRLTMEGLIREYFPKNWIQVLYEYEQACGSASNE